MKLLSSDEQRLVFELTAVEFELLAFTLSAFPIPHEPPAGQSPPAQGDPAAPDPALLAEILHDSKRAHRSRLSTFLEQQPSPTPAGKRPLLLAKQDLDWFLQVINDVRVGSWYALGCPDEDEEEGISITGENVQHKIRMSVAGQVICRLLDALDES